MADSGTRPSRTGRWIAWLVVVLVAAAVIGAAVASGRVWVAAAAAIGLVVAWLVTGIVRLIRRRPRPGLALLALVPVLGFCAFALLFFRANSGQSIDPGPGPGPVTVRYHAVGELNGATVVLTEEIVVDADTTAALERTLGPSAADGEQLAVPQGWQTAPPVDGYPTFTRTRTLTPDEDSLVASTVTIPMEAGRMPVRHQLVTLVIREGSRVVLTGPKGAFGATYPEAATTANDPRRDGGEVTTINVDRNVLDVSVAVLKGPLQNPAGQQIYEAFVWGPLPWAVGAVFAFVASLFGDKIKQLLGLAARRAMRTGRRTPGDPLPQEVG